MYLFFFSQKDKVKNIFQSCVHFLKTCKYLHFSQNHFHSSLWVRVLMMAGLFTALRLSFRKKDQSYPKNVCKWNSLLKLLYLKSRWQCHVFSY